LFLTRYQTGRLDGSAPHGAGFQNFRDVRGGVRRGGQGLSNDVPGSLWIAKQVGGSGQYVVTRPTNPPSQLSLPPSLSLSQRAQLSLSLSLSPPPPPSLNPTPSTLNPQPSTPNPKPQTPNPTPGVVSLQVTGHPLSSCPSRSLPYPLSPSTSRPVLPLPPGGATRESLYTHHWGR
jgi:hypothetical protein